MVVEAMNGGGVGQDTERLVTAIVMELSEEGEAGRIYLNMDVS